MPAFLRSFIPFPRTKSPNRPATNTIPFPSSSPPLPIPNSPIASPRHSHFLAPPSSPFAALSLNVSAYLGGLRFTRSTGDLHETDSSRLVIPSPASPQLTPLRMPYMAPPSPLSPPAAGVPFPTKTETVPPTVVRASVTSTSNARETSDDIRDANNAATPLRVPRSRSRASLQFVPAIATSSDAQTHDGGIHSGSDLSSSPSTSKSGAIRVKRPRPRESIITIAQQPPTPLSPPALAEDAPRTLSSPPTRHQPVRSGPGLKLDFAAIKRTYSESQVTTPPLPQKRLSESRVPTILRKKSGEVLKSSLKPFMPAGPNSVALHLPSPARSTFTSRSPSPVGNGPRTRMPCKSAPATPTSSKSVHFDEQLERVKLFSSEQKPLAVSRDGSPTEDSDTSGTERGRRQGGLASYPFAPLSPSSEDDRFRASLTLRIVNATPSVRDALPYGVEVQAQSFALTPDKRDVHIGVLVRNLGFHKTVVVRFTLDNWQTTSEIAARHVESVWSNTSLRGRCDPDVDRFLCTVKLGDFGGRIKSKTMQAAVRFEANGCQYWDNNHGVNYQIVFELKEELPSEPPSPTMQHQQQSAQWGNQLNQKLELYQHQQSGEGRRGSGRSGQYTAAKSLTVPSSGHATKSRPGMPFGSSSGHRQWNSESSRSQHHRLNALSFARGSPRDLDDPEFMHYRPPGHPGDGGSDSELETRGGPKFRKRPNSYFDFAPSPASVTYGYQMPQHSHQQQKAGPHFVVGGGEGDPSASSSDYGSDTPSSPSKPKGGKVDMLAPAVVIPDPPSEESSDTEPVASPSSLVAPVLLEDRSRTSSSSSLSSTSSSWDVPPSPLNGELEVSNAFITAVYDGASLSPISMISTPAVSTATSTSANSPDSPSSPADEYAPHAAVRSFMNLDAFFGASGPGRPAVDSANYAVFLDRFCYYTGKDGETQAAVKDLAPAAPIYAAAPRRMTVHDDYFGPGLSLSSSGPRYSEPASNMLPPIHSTLAAAEAPSTPPAADGMSGHSTPTTPRAGTPITNPAHLYSTLQHLSSPSAIPFPTLAASTPA